MECDNERMVATSISTAELISLISQTLDKLKDNKQEVDFSNHQYYWMFEFGALLDVQTEPWKRAGHGDLHFDLYTLCQELKHGVSSPEMILKTLSMILYAIAVIENE